MDYTKVIEVLKDLNSTKEQKQEAYKELYSFFMVFRISAQDKSYRIVDNKWGEGVFSVDISLLLEEVLSTNYISGVWIPPENLEQCVVIKCKFGSFAFSVVISEYDKLIEDELQSFVADNNVLATIYKEAYKINFYKLYHLTV